MAEIKSLYIEGIDTNKLIPEPISGRVLKATPTGYEWADDAGEQSLAQVLDVGNVTDGYDLEVSGGSSINITDGSIISTGTDLNIDADAANAVAITGATFTVTTSDLFNLSSTSGKSSINASELDINATTDLDLTINGNAVITLTSDSITDQNDGYVLAWNSSGLGYNEYVDPETFGGNQTLEETLANGNTTGAVAIVIEAGSGITSTGTDIEITPDTGFGTLVDSDLTVTGNLTIDGYTTNINSQQVNIADNNLLLNQGYTVESARTGGLTINYLPTSTKATVDGDFTAGVGGGANPTVDTDGTFATGDLIMIDGGSDANNNGLFEVLSETGGLVTIRGVGSTGTVESFTQTQFITEDGTGATVTKVNVSVIRAGTDGEIEVGKGNQTGITFTDVAVVGGIDLQQAYQAGNTITAADANGNIDFTLTEATNFVVHGTGTGLMDISSIGFDSDININAGGDATLSSQANTANPQLLALSATNAGAGTAGISLTATDTLTITTTAGNITSNAIDGFNQLSAAGTAGSATDVNISASNSGAGDASVSVTAKTLFDVIAPTTTITSAEGGIVTNSTSGTDTTFTIGGANAGAGNAILALGSDVTSLFATNVGGLTLNGGTDALIWPAADGTSGQVIVTDAAGNLSWADNGGTNETLQEAYEAGNTITAADANGDISFTLTEATDFIANATGTGNISLSVSDGYLILNGGTDALIWPAADGTVDQVLVTDGSGNLSWADDSSNDSQGAIGNINQADGSGAWLSSFWAFNGPQTLEYQGGAAGIIQNQVNQDITVQTSGTGDAYLARSLTNQIKVGDGATGEGVGILGGTGNVAISGQTVSLASLDAVSGSAIVSAFGAGSVSIYSGATGKTTVTGSGGLELSGSGTTAADIDTWPTAQSNTGDVLHASADGVLEWLPLPPASTPGGSDTQIQFNDSGDFGGSADFTWDGSELNVTGDIRSSADGYFENVVITDKLTVGGLIDPIGLVLTKVSDKPYNETVNDGVIWIDSDDGYLYFNDEVIGGADVVTANLAQTLVSGETTGNSSIILNSSTPTDGILSSGRNVTITADTGYDVDITGDLFTINSTGKSTISAGDLDVTGVTSIDLIIGLEPAIAITQATVDSKEDGYLIAWTGFENEYIDPATLGGNQTLEETLANGNVTGGSDIEITKGDGIVGEAGVANEGGDVAITAGAGDTNQDGGDVVITSGAGAGTGSDGVVEIQGDKFFNSTATNTTAVLADIVTIDAAAIPNSTVVMVETKILGRNGDTDAAAYKVTAIFDKTAAGTLTQIGNTNIVVEEESDAAWHIAIVADGAGGIDIQAHGDGATVSWLVVGSYTLHTSA